MRFSIAREISEPQDRPIKITHTEHKEKKNEIIKWNKTKRRASETKQIEIPEQVRKKGETFSKIMKYIKSEI